MGATRERVVWATFVAVGLLLALVAVCPVGGPGERLDRRAMAQLRGGDTFITWTIESCDSLNGFVPNCTTPGMPCQKCSESSGGKMVFGGAGEGWRVIAAFNCGNVQNGTCSPINVCVPAVTTGTPCQDLLLVDRQPVAGPK